MSGLNLSRWIALIAVLSGLMLGSSIFAKHQQSIDYQQATAEYTAAALIAEKAAREKEQAMQAATMKAVNAATERQKKLALDAGTLRAERDRLRSDLAASLGELPGAACDAVRARASTLTAVFDRCSGAFADLAATSDRYASESLMYQEGWPH